MGVCNFVRYYYSLLELKNLQISKLFVQENKNKCLCCHSSTAKVTLWEEQVGILHDQTSYKLENFVVREFGGTKYLSMGSESKVIPIEEIKDAKTNRS